MKVVKGTERSAIQEFLLQFMVDIRDVEGALVLIGNRVFLVDKVVLKTARDIAKRGIMPYALGVEIGTLSEGFEPSLELAGVISGLTDAKTVVSKEGETLFSYGRDVFLSNIVEGKVEGQRIVINEEGEVLGFGFFDGNMLKNVIDKGFYLRGKKGRR